MNDRSDRLYDLLPAIYRLRDAEQGYALKALLRVIAEQVNVVEDDIRQLYDNWFIETAQDWVVPYLGDLIGYQLVHEAGEPGDPTSMEGAARNKILIPRRDVANTIRYRRRKGTLAVLEELARDVAGWPARAVEFFKLLGWTQNINHLHLDRARTIDVRDGDALDLIDGPFDTLAHTVDVRRINSARTIGRYNIPSVGVFVWRLKVYSVTQTSAYCLEQVGPHCYTFSVLGQDTPLYVKPQPETDPVHIADEMNLPVPIRRRSFERWLDRYYGEGRSLAIYADWASHDPNQPLPSRSIIAADLTDWTYVPPRNHIAVDPVLGRIAFPSKQLPKKVRVSYHYAFSADIGGGEYDRPLSQPQTFTLYRVGDDEAYKRIGEVLRQWQHDQPKDAVIEFADSGVYVEQINITLQNDQSLQLRAANHVRPIIRLIDWQTDQPDALNVTLNRDSRFTLDGLLITGRAVQINGAPRDRSDQAAAKVCPAEVTIRHCTLVPGWGLDNDCQPLRPAEPSLELNNVRARVTIEHSIVGTLQVNEDEVRIDPIPIHISDSIVDAMDADREAIGAPGNPVAHAVLTIQRSTVFGIVQVHAIELAENSIFMGCLNVARRQLGCMRFCYVPPGCRTPKRYHCQSDLAEQTIESQMRHDDPNITQTAIAAAKESERARVKPQFNSERYGQPAYAQLAATCADEITRGADDESEMGVFHDLFQPQRAANLHARLNEYTPAGMNVGIIFAS
jgi:hypothetical protein